MCLPRLLFVLISCQICSLSHVKSVKLLSRIVKPNSKFSKLQQVLQHATGGRCIITLCTLQHMSSHRGTARSADSPAGLFADEIAAARSARPNSTLNSNQIKLLSHREHVYLPKYFTSSHPLDFGFTFCEGLKTERVKKN